MEEDEIAKISKIKEYLQHGLLQLDDQTNNFSNIASISPHLPFQSKAKYIPYHDWPEFSVSGSQLSSGLTTPSHQSEESSACGSTGSYSGVNIFNALSQNDTAGICVNADVYSALDIDWSFLRPGRYSAYDKNESSDFFVPPPTTHNASLSQPRKSFDINQFHHLEVMHSNVAMQPFDKRLFNVKASVVTDVSSAPTKWENEDPETEIPLFNVSEIIPAIQNNFSFQNIHMENDTSGNPSQDGMMPISELNSYLPQKLPSWSQTHHSDQPLFRSSCCSETAERLQSEEDNLRKSTMYYSQLPAYGKVYKDSTSLKQHVRKHKVEKHLACKHCKRMFLPSYMYKRPLRTHLKENCFVCVNCTQRSKLCKRFEAPDHSQHYL